MSKPKVLIVDDNVANLVALEDTFSDLDVELIKAKKGNEALKEALNHDFALMVIDVQMPEMDGYELAALLRGKKRTQYVPIIFVSAVYSDEYHVYRGYKAGAVDFVSKPYNPKTLVSKAEVFISLYTANRELKISNKALLEKAEALEQTNKTLQAENSKRMQAEDELRALLSEKEILLREIHHRVKNNMQVITSLLRIQAKSIKDPDVRTALQESQSRIRAMSLVHETLYHQNSLAGIDMKQYLGRLAKNLRKIYGNIGAGIEIAIDIDELFFDIDHAIPCGLIINELVSNSFKYAFPEGGPGKISIMAKSADEGGIDLVVSDDGVGLPDDVVFQDAETMGFGIISSLAERQLGGTVEIMRDQGTQFCFKFGHPSFCLKCQLENEGC
ncbi:MAG: response regulator [Desulfobacterales bacterium]|nr:response regulator [Desulfobacterales bacterium]